MNPHHFRDFLLFSFFLAWKRLSPFAPVPREKGLKTVNCEYLDYHAFSWNGRYTVGKRVKISYFYASEHFLWIPTIFEIFHFFRFWAWKRLSPFAPVPREKGLKNSKSRISRVPRIFTEQAVYRWKGGQNALLLCLQPFLMNPQHFWDFSKIAIFEHLQARKRLSPRSAPCAPKKTGVTRFTHLGVRTAPENVTIIT